LLDVLALVIELVCLVVLADYLLSLIGLLTVVASVAEVILV
jgi:hypothetical protein